MSASRNGIGLLLVLAILGWFLFFRAGDTATSHPYSDEPQSKPMVVASTDASGPGGTVEPPHECESLQDYLNGPAGYRLDDWMQSWGAPPIAGNRMPSKVYLNYELNTLIALAENDDVGAQHELGLSLVWSALGTEDRAPADASLWDLGISPFQYAETVDTARLRVGRDWLYQAAINGRTYALMEISVSYAKERLLRDELGTLSAEEALALQVLTYAYGEAVEELIPAWGEQYFNAPVPLALVDQADRALADIVAGVQREMAARGVRPVSDSDEPRALLEFMRECPGQ